jgi:orotate phosphoribosyltransferase
VTAAAPAADVRVGNPALVADLLKMPGAIRTGHFALLSGLHTDHFLAFSTIAADARALADLASWLTPVVAAWQPDTVLAPSTAGVSLAGELARRTGASLHLADLDQHGRPCGIVGDGLRAGTRCLLVNDVVTTGSGMRLLADVARDAGATVVGGAWFASRAAIDVTTIINAPTVHAADLELPTRQPDSCELCNTDAKLQIAIDLN